MQITINPETLQLLPGSEVFFSQQGWSDYEFLLELRQEKTLPKIYFNARSQIVRLLSPLAGHGNRVNILADLVKALLNYHGQDWHCFDPITLKKIPQAGLEPDRCFYLGDRSSILGKEKIDLTVDPPPDLALEVDLTSHTNPADYHPLGILELWIYRLGGLFIYLWQESGYQESFASQIFPEFDVKNILPDYVELAWQKGCSFTLREFNKYLQNR